MDTGNTLRVASADVSPLSLTINGTTRHFDVPARRLLSDLIREDAELTGTHVGCEQGVCGACTVLMDGRAVRSCLILAIQAEGRSITTVEALEGDDGALHPLQEGFRRAHGLQCGFCTAGFLMSLEAFVREVPDVTEEAIREAIAGNLCRCTGYQGIVEAVRYAVSEFGRIRSSEGGA